MKLFYIIKDYQLDFITPGKIPEARPSRTRIRESLKVRIIDFVRPVAWQFFVTFTIELLRGKCRSFNRAAAPSNWYELSRERHLSNLRFISNLDEYDI